MIHSVDNRLRLSLACLLLGLYLLVYVPRINSADGEAILAVAAAAMRHGIPDIAVTGANEALIPFEFARMGAFGMDGGYYSKKGVTPSLALLPLVFAAERVPWLTTRATAMLFNPLVTTLTALALYTLLRWLKYRPRTAFLTGLLYGIATFALVYTKTLFGEPLAALLLLLAVMGAYRYRQYGKTSVLMLSSLCAGLLIGINMIYVLIVPVIGFYALLPDMGAKWSIKSLIRATITYSLPIIGALAFIGLYNAVRFGSPFSTGYHFGSGEGFTADFVEGFLGLTIRPYRGLFWYNPLLLLAIPGWLMLRRSAPRLAWLALALVILQIVSFATWWSWEGGVAWGPRFLLTIIPLLALSLAPLIETAWENRWLALCVTAFALLSLAVQALGALYSIYPFISYQYEHYYDLSKSMLAPDVLIHPGLSAIIGHLALLLKGWPLEPVWIANGLDAVHLAAALALMGAGIIIGMIPRLKSDYRLTAGVVGIILLCLNITVARQQHGEAYDRIAGLQNLLQPSANVLAASTIFGESLLDLKNSERVVSTNAPTSSDDALTLKLTHYAQADTQFLWFVSWFPAGDNANWQEKWLWENAAFALEKSAADHRALLFHLAPIVPDKNGGWRFGPIILERYGFKRDEHGLLVTIEWQPAETVEGDYRWFIHVIDAGGSILAQQDRLPAGGYEPTSQWKVGEIVTDRLFFPDITGDELRLRVGYINAAGERLPTIDSENNTLADGYALLAIP